MSVKEKHYFEVNTNDFIDQDTEDGKKAWDELTSHHAIPYVLGGRFLLTQYWAGYSNDPYENLETCINDYADEWENEGMLGKVVADYIRSFHPDFDDWNSVLIYVE